MAHDATFRHSIPGSSLTHKMGSLPHEKPPKYVDPNEALEYLWKQFHRKDILKQIWSILENGGTSWAITRAVLYKACLEGVIQMNLATVIYPTVGKMITAIGQAKGIKVNLNPKFRDKIKDKTLNDKLLEKIGDKSGKQIPTSALKYMMLPKPEDITNDTKKFLQQKQTTKEPETGLLSGSNK
jgi:hypothetical protein